MNSTQLELFKPRLIIPATLLLFAAAALAQTPVDEDGQPIGPVYSDTDAVAAADDEIVLLNATELAELIGPVALYPDDLLAIVLPAATYPLQVVQAARFLEELETDSSLQPDEAWDDAVVALLNYPEVLQMMSNDIDWTWRLGEAVVAQQNDVVAAVEAFRDRAYVAGNLKSDERQTVSLNEDNVVEIEPATEDVIYVPYYEPERVVVHQTVPVYHYYPRAYPVYYYPYPAGHYFATNFFWGVTTAYQIGWFNNRVRVYHPSYRGHPYYGWNYFGNYWRRPSIYVFNTWYGGHYYGSRSNRYDYGNYWRPRRTGGPRPGYYRNRDRVYSDRRRSNSEDGYADRDYNRERRNANRQPRVNRTNTPAARRNSVAPERSGNVAPRMRNRDSGNQPAIRFRNRPERAADAAQRRADPPAPRSGNARRATVAPDRSNANRSRAQNPRANRAARSSSHQADVVLNPDGRRNPQPRLTNRRGSNDAVQRARPQQQSALPQRARSQSRTAPQQRARPQQRSAPQSRSAPQQRARPQQRSAPRSQSAPRVRSGPAATPSARPAPQSRPAARTPARGAAAPRNSVSRSPARSNARSARDRRRQR